jgi:hypothetical protein
MHRQFQTFKKKSINEFDSSFLEGNDNNSFNFMNDKESLKLHILKECLRGCKLYNEDEPTRVCFKKCVKDTNF